MKRSVLLSLLCLIPLVLVSQTRLGFSGSIGGSQIIPVANGKIGDFSVVFTPGVATSLAFTTQIKISSKVFLKGDLGINNLRSPGSIPMQNINDIERILRVNFPVEVHFLGQGIIGGFIGINNSLNIALSNSFIDFLVVPYTLSFLSGFSYAALDKLLISLSYSMDVLAFAEAQPCSWFFLLDRPQHFHFGIISIGFSYFPWALKKAGHHHLMTCLY